MNTLIRRTLAAGAAASMTAGLVLVASTGPAAAATAPPWEPDPGSIGSLSFYDAAGHAVTGGDLSDAPFAAYVQGSANGRSGDTKATLFGYLPKSGQEPSAWSGEALTASTTYPNPSAPGALGTSNKPLVSLTGADFTLADLVADFPNTGTGDYAGLYQLRLKTSGPGQTAGAQYQSADILVDGDTWSVAYPEPTSNECVGGSGFDVNGDGIGDFVVGTPLEDLGSGASLKANAGAVSIVYGTADGKGLGTAGSKQLTQENLGLVSVAGDRFGTAVLTANLDGTGCRDLVIGIPGKNGGKGQVVLVYLDKSGVTGTEVLGLGVGGTSGTAKAGDKFGSSLALTDWSDATTGRLWVGTPGRDVGSQTNAGLVTLFPHDPSGVGVNRAAAKHFNQDSAGVPGTAKAGNQFGSVLADRGGATGVAIGVPLYDAGAKKDVGVVYLASPTGAPWQIVSQNSTGIPGTAEAGEHFGAALASVPSCSAAGAYALVVGTPGQKVGTQAKAGNLTVVDLSGTSKAFRQGAGGVNGTAEAGDQFGASLAADSAGRVFVGVPTEDVGKAKDGGLVHQLGLKCTAATKSWSVAWSSQLYEDTTSVPGTAATGDRFGARLAIRQDVAPDASAVEFLVVSAPGKTVAKKAKAGSLWVFNTFRAPSSGGASGTGSKQVTADTSGIAGTSEAGAAFGSVLEPTTG